MTKEALAARIVQFVKDYNPYDFWDAYDSTEDAEVDHLEMLDKGCTGAILDFLEDARDYCLSAWDCETADTAEELISAVLAI